MQSRRTIQTPVTVTGVGIHTGADARVTLHPTSSDTAGIRLLRNGQTIPVHHSSVVDTSRCTVLGAEGTTVSTVEHLLSACAGLGVTDLTVEIDGPELPIGDGSAILWADALRESGLVEIGQVPTPTISTLLTVSDVKRGIFLAARPSDHFRALVHIAFDHPLIGAQTAAFEAEGGDYATEIAPARTFGFIEEVEALLKAGLAKGGSFDNAVVVYQDHYSTDLRFPEELARHKLLDLMGDLLLATGGMLPNVDVVAVKPSHRMNAALAAQIAGVVGTK